MRERKILNLAALASAAALAAAPLRAQGDSSPWEKLKFSEVIRSVTIGGDLRLRNENLERRSAGQDDRNRFRYRLRIGADIVLPQDVLVGLRLASGAGDQFSTNQSLDNFSSQKAIWVDRVFLLWSPKLHEAWTVRLTGGRLPNPFWVPASADIIWDDDLNPEGFSQSLEWNRGSFKAFGNALQFVVDEDADTSRNQWLFSEQLGAEAPLYGSARLRLAAAYHKWSDENRSSFGQVGTLEGNRRIGNILTNRFGTGELTGELSLKARGLPLAFQGTAARNFRARGDLAPPARDGYQYGVILGNAKERRSWEAAFFKKYSQTDVTVADMADSDFGDGGTNRTGTVTWLAFNPEDWLLLKAKFYYTDVIDTQFPPGVDDVNRLQLDLIVKF